MTIIKEKSILFTIDPEDGCPNCGTPFSEWIEEDEELFCPFCGYSVPNRRQREEIEEEEDLDEYNDI
jgi:uncharacterized Zn finger protein (UPF0148 family)